MRVFQINPKRQAKTSRSEYEVQFHFYRKDGTNVDVRPKRGGHAFRKRRSFHA